MRQSGGEKLITGAANFAAYKLGYEEGLKEMQVKIITVFGVLPTGYGKSLCYTCLPDVFDCLIQPEESCIIFVVTRRTAIMEDLVKLFYVVCNTCI